MLNIVIAIIVGCALGIATFALSRQMIVKRTGEKPISIFFGKVYSIVIWMALGAVGCIWMVTLTSEIVKIVEYVLVYMVLVSLSVVDGSIRKIPNILLLVLIITKIVSVAISGEWMSLLIGLAAFVIAWILFTFPARWGISIGWGDIKLAAVAGFYLGIIGFFQAVLIMGVVLSIYMVYLKVTKKGNLKTQVAIGPPLSIGVIIALIQPITITLPMLT